MFIYSTTLGPIRYKLLFLSCLLIARWRITNMATFGFPQQIHLEGVHNYQLLLPKSPLPTTGIQYKVFDYIQNYKKNAY